MKNFRLLFMVVPIVGSFSYAGGEFREVTPYEVEDVVVAEEEAFVEPVMELEEPVYVEPEVTEPIKPKPIPIPVAKPKNIATNGFYAGLGITGVKYEHNCKCITGGTSENKDTTYGLMGRVGYDFNQYVGIEARGSKTNWGSDGSKVRHAGIYAKPMIPIGTRSNLYGLAGYAKTTVRGKLPEADVKGLALGAGIEIDISKDKPKDGKYARTFDGQGDQEKGVGLFLDYERMHVKSGSPDIDAVSAGVTYDF